MRYIDRTGEAMKRRRPEGYHRSSEGRFYEDHEAIASRHADGGDGKQKESRDASSDHGKTWKAFDVTDVEGSLESPGLAEKVWQTTTEHE